MWSSQLVYIVNWIECDEIWVPNGSCSSSIAASAQTCKCCRGYYQRSAAPPNPSPVTVFTPTAVRVDTIHLYRRNLSPIHLSSIFSKSRYLPSIHCPETPNRCQKTWSIFSQSRRSWSHSARAMIVRTGEVAESPPKSFIGEDSLLLSSDGQCQSRDVVNSAHIRCWSKWAYKGRFPIRLCAIET